MSGWRLEPAANARLDEIYEYTANRWGEDQADRYVLDLFACFESIARRETLWRSVPAAYGVEGYYARCGIHFIYWRDEPEEIVIAAILHERMNQSLALGQTFARGA